MKLDDFDIRKVDRELEKMGYAYPPDAIRAVAEGRESYHPLDPAITYNLSGETRKVIQRALDKVKPPYDYEESLRITEAIRTREENLRKEDPSPERGFQR